jgi:hypothetical protein
VFESRVAESTYQPCCPKLSLGNWLVVVSRPIRGFTPQPYSWRREWDSDDPSMLEICKLLKIRIVKIVKTHKTQGG